MRLCGLNPVVQWKTVPGRELGPLYRFRVGLGFGVGLGFRV